MAITRVQSDTDTGTSTAPTATLAAAAAEGSLLVCALRVNSATASVTPRAGWTKLTEVTSSQRTCLLYRVAGAVEPATLSPCDLSASVAWSCIGVEYSGTALANVLDVEGAQVDNNAVKTSPAVGPSDLVERLALGYVMSSTFGSPWSAIKIGGSTSGVSTVVSGSLVLLFEKIFTTAAATTYAAEATASTSANGTAHVAFFRGLNSQTISPAAAT